MIKKFTLDACVVALVGTGIGVCTPTYAADVQVEVDAGQSADGRQADEIEKTAESDQSAATDEVSADSSGSAGGLEIDEIVVTARKRAETAQSVPLALTALNSAALERVQATDILDLGAHPNLQITQQLATTDVAAIYLRGFGIGSNEPNVEPAIAVFVDGIYQSVLTGTLSDLFDVETVEILRGPQGTLLGKNSPSGAISIRTKRPTGDYSGKVAFSYERFDRAVTQGLVNFPIIQDVLSGNFSAALKSGGGFVENHNPNADDKVLGDSNIRTARLGLLYKPSDVSSWYFTTSFYANDSDQGGLRNISSNVDGGPYQGVPIQCSVLNLCTPNLDPHTTFANYTRAGNIDQYSATLDGSVQLGRVELASLTGYKDYKGINNQDVDGINENILTAVENVQKNEQFSQELRLSSSKGGGLDFDGRLDWVVGAYFFTQDYDLTQPLIVLESPIVQQQAGANESYALFAHNIFDLTTAWNVSFGARQTWDKKKHNYVPAGFSEADRSHESKSFDELTIELGSQYKFDSGRLVYVRYAQGYRGGGFVGIPGTPNTGKAYDPETVDAYEVGVKSDWMGGRLRTNLYGFYGKYDDLQRTGAVPSEGSGFLLITQNAASATVKGVELESRALITSALEASLSAGYLDASYDKYLADLVGNGNVEDVSYFRFPFAPKWTANAGVNYTIDTASWGSITFGASYDYRSRHLLRISDIPAADQKGYGLLDASIRLVDPSEKWTFTLYGRNIADKEYLTQVEPNGGLSTLVVDGVPRIWGLAVSVTF